MLHLKPRVHLHEPESVGAQPARSVGDELDRPRSPVANGFGRAHRRLAHRLARLRRHARRGRLLDHLLVAALQRTVALEQVHGALPVPEDLELDVPRPRDELLDEHAVVAEGRLRLGAGALERLAERVGRLDEAHAPAAAARHRLDQHRIADPLGGGAQPLRIVLAVMEAGNHRHPGLLHQPLRGILQPHRGHCLGRRADEDQPGRLHGSREVGILAEKPVSGMDRLRPLGQRRLDHRVDAQVAVGGRRGADAHRRVGHQRVPGGGVGVGVDRHGGDAHPPGGLNHPAGDLAPVRHEDPVEHRPPPVTS